MAPRLRILRTVVARSLREFPVTTLVGLRQVGKTTLARRVDPRRTYVTLDDLTALEAARRDPQGFLRGLPRPVTIDEVQRVPELLLPIKSEVDRRRRPGQFLLTGSARIEMGRGVRETLAGRASLLRLRPMTWSERAGRPDWNPVDTLFSCRGPSAVPLFFGTSRAFDGARLLAGGLPVALLARRGSARARWFAEYEAAYLERDVPAVLRVEESAAFLRFLALAAARTGQTTNFAALAHEAGLSADTGLRWCGVLEATFVADLVAPYWRNIGKRLVKSPKLHFGDAGVAAHLMGLRSWTDAKRLHVAGPLVETLVAQHLLAFTEAARRPTALYHYRTHAGAEVDFVLACGAKLIPVEVKSGETVKRRELGGMESFMGDFKRQVPVGIVLTGGSECVPLGRGMVAVPLTAFLEGPRAVS